MKPLLIFLVIAIFAIQTTVTQTTGKSKTSNVNEVPFYVMVLMVFIFFLLSCLISGLLYICMLCIEQYRENRFVENPEEQSSMEMFTPMRRPIPNPSFNKIHPV
ncbi:hypothetical protein L5515_009650 [Caenorhabditis briggsae]|uniref:Uncharacterized protein n=1 Tax=Caenorhabditis briggsae TaxID=6238 RepID=A0AAE9D202_CAEBR|nr:hypothetical protein L3Y34_009845 [Caenorhabditis briggsae]UMM38094.1 hypothetical protein L5515_009650 [Caenorhabditis briggsae]